MRPHDQGSHSGHLGALILSPVRVYMSSGSDHAGEVATYPSLRGMAKQPQDLGITRACYRLVMLRLESTQDTLRGRGKAPSSVLSSCLSELRS